MYTSEYILHKSQVNEPSIFFYQKEGYQLCTVTICEIKQPQNYISSCVKECSTLVMLHYVCISCCADKLLWVSLDTHHIIIYFGQAVSKAHLFCCIKPYYSIRFQQRTQTLKTRSNCVCDTKCSKNNNFKKDKK